MKSQSNIMQDKIWVRGVENGIRHITLRRNFIEKIVNHIEIQEKIYEYEETNIYIINRENIEDYVESNFNVLFEQGLLDENATKPLTELELLQKQLSQSNDDNVATMEALAEVYELMLGGV